MTCIVPVFFEVLKRAESTSVESMIVKAQIRWTGLDVIRMDNSGIQRRMLYDLFPRQRKLRQTSKTL